MDIDAALRRYAACPKNGLHRSVIRQYGGIITIWRGGSVREYFTTLASYRRIRRWMAAQP